MPRMRTIVWVGAGLLLLGVGCGIALRRDLSAIPPGQVGFDDMCGLQEYFDALEIKTAPPPRVVSALDLEGQSGGKTTRGGKERFAFEDDFQLKHLRRVLNQNWRRLPPELATANAIEIEVRWSEKAGAKRVVTDQDSELAAPLPPVPLRAALWSAALSPAARDVGAAAAGAGPRRRRRHRAAADLDRSAGRRRRRGSGRRPPGLTPAYPPSQTRISSGPPNR